MLLRPRVIDGLFLIAADFRNPDPGEDLHVEAETTPMPNQCQQQSGMAQFRNGGIHRVCNRWRDAMLREVFL
jgi:hypothetical protein